MALYTIQLLDTCVARQLLDTCEISLKKFNAGIIIIIIIIINFIYTSVQMNYIVHLDRSRDFK